MNWIILDLNFGCGKKLSYVLVFVLKAEKRDNFPLFECLKSVVKVGKVSTALSYRYLHVNGICARSI